MIHTYRDLGCAVGGQELARQDQDAGRGESKTAGAHLHSRLSAPTHGAQGRSLFASIVGLVCLYSRSLSAPTHGARGC